MSLTPRKSGSKLLGIWTFLLLLIFKGAFPKPAYALLSSLDACAAQPECAAAISSELAPSVAAPSSAGVSASTITTSSGAAVTAAGRVVILGTGATAGAATWYFWNQPLNDEAQQLAQQKYCAANPGDSVCVPFTGGQIPNIPYNVTFEAWTANRNESWYPHTIFTIHYGFHEPGGSNDLVTGPIHTVDVLQQLSLDGNSPRMCYGVID